jgi:hypothetical protein
MEPLPRLGRHLETANFFKYCKELRLRGQTHGSIRIQEGEPSRLTASRRFSASNQFLAETTDVATGTRGSFSSPDRHDTNSELPQVPTSHRPAANPRRIGRSDTRSAGATTAFRPSNWRQMRLSGHGSMLGCPRAGT